ncbi:MAG: 16S rRNA (uracil(1498)-N(3))-methyltransferase [Phormidesmis sp.]
MQRITIDQRQIQDSSLILEADQVHYLRRVLRMGAGDRFIAQDGQGQQWLAALTEQPRSAQIIETAAQERSRSLLTLVAALPKGNGFDQVVRQTTELGVTHIFPVLSQRTLLNPSERKLSRWRRIAQEAAEQSERMTVPNISPPVDFQQCLAQLDRAEDSNPGLRYLCVARSIGSMPPPHLLAHLQSQLTSATPVTLAVGPEGGWTPDEITAAIARRYVAVSLGPVILRAVTAPVTALSLVTAARELLV